MTRTLVPDEVVRIKAAGIDARPALKSLLDDARAYPASYSRERVMQEADVILDAALDKVDKALADFPPEAMPKCIVCDDQGGGFCEFCPR